MKKFSILSREEVSPANQVLFDKLEKLAGHVPNLYSVFAYSENALSNYLALQSGKSSLRGREKEVVNLVVSEINGCAYCLAAHTGLAKMQGFTDEQILEIRRASISFDDKLDALARLVKSITENKGHADEALVDKFYAAGYDQGSLVDVVIAIGDKIITNYLYALTGIPIDYPLAMAI
jgi:AhpD family alkylhydroperoxidase